jgi:hypothetical protein
VKSLNQTHVKDLQSLDLQLTAKINECQQLDELCAEVKAKVHTLQAQCDEQDN